jgi:hypothetical protein
MLQMTNQFKGGKILPNAGSYDAISTQIPLHVITGSDKARAFHEKTMAKRRGLTTNQPKVFLPLFFHGMHELYHYQ